MLNEKKIKMMTRIAIYENNIGKEDLELNDYFKNYYVSKNNIVTRLGITFVCLCIFGIHFTFEFFKIFIEPNFNELLVNMGIKYLIGYGIILAFFTVISTIIYRKKYNEAQVRLRGYNKILSILSESDTGESGR